MDFRGKIAIVTPDAGMTRQMVYHGDNGWKLEK